MQLKITKEVLKRQIEVMRAYLKEKEITLSQSHSYELLSKIYGARNWNTLSAMIKDSMQ
jgi:hypothetical protein